MDNEVRLNVLNMDMNMNINMDMNMDMNVNKILDDDAFFFNLEHDNENNVNCTHDTNTHDDNIMALHVDYSENYNIKMLHHICNYYNIPKNKIKKDDLITRIIDYENNPENSYQVYNRKRYWHYILELQKDDYFAKFVVFS